MMIDSKLCLNIFVQAAINRRLAGVRGGRYQSSFCGACDSPEAISIFTS